MSAIQQHRRLVANLVRWLTMQPASGRVELIETHISSVILAGEFAYKIKKPLDLGFLDFSTLERRRFCCEEELRLNRRLTENLYLQVVKITGTGDRPALETNGEVIEYAVKMRRFQGGILLSEQPDLLSDALADRLAQQLAGFHAAIGPAATLPPHGMPDQVLQPMQQNFDQIRSLSAEYDAPLAQLQAATLAAYRSLERRLAERRAEGYIRECHGDLHLGNIVLEGDRLILFDGIEFNPELRWIDTMSELAFLLMDIEEKGMFPISRRLLNRYLEISGDYRGLDVLRFYQLYRAMVRAKVVAIRLHQAAVTGDERRRLQAEFSTYLENAQRYTHSAPPWLMITHGLSGSGKSTVSGELLRNLPAVRIRSDIERKRLAGLDAASGSASPPMGGIYTPDFSNTTYAHLLSLTHSVLCAGYAVIIDATFQKRGQRQEFQALSSRLGAPFLILDFQVPERELRKRLEARERLGTDPSEANAAVLNEQLRSAEKLTAEEHRCAVVVTTKSGEKRDLAEQVRHRLGNQ